MVQKSGHHQLRLVVSPIIYRVLYILDSAGFLPSTVSWLCCRCFQEATNWGVQLCMLSVGLCCWPGLRMTWDHLTPLPKEQWLTETAKHGNIPQTVAQQFTPILFRHVSNRLSHGADDCATCCCLDLQDPEDSCAQHPWGSWKQSANGRSNSWHLTWSYWGINSLVRSVLPMQQPGGQLRQPRPSAVFQARPKVRIRRKQGKAG